MTVEFREILLGGVGATARSEISKSELATRFQFHLAARDNSLFLSSSQKYLGILQPEKERERWLAARKRERGLREGCWERYLSL